MSLKKVAWVATVASSGALFAAQLILVKRTNPPSPDALSAPPGIQATFKRSCYDCHSNETRWPWYSRTAPMSWLIVRDVMLGRSEVNFSEWRSYYRTTRRRKLKWIGRALREETMPPWSYRLMHPSARLTEADRAALRRWIESALTTASTQKSDK